MTDTTEQAATADAEDLRAELLEMAHDLIQVGLRLQAHAQDPDGDHLKSRASGRFEITRWPAATRAGDSRTKRFTFPTFEAVVLLTKRYLTATDHQRREAGKGPAR